MFAPHVLMHAVGKLKPSQYRWPYVAIYRQYAWPIYLREKLVYDAKNFMFMTDNSFSTI